jgi:hypothetical protein
LDKVQRVETMAINQPSVEQYGIEGLPSETPKSSAEACDVRHFDLSLPPPMKHGQSGSRLHFIFLDQ